MKRFCLKIPMLFCLMLLASSVASAQNTLVVHNKSGDPGLEDSPVRVTLSNTASVGAVEFIIVDNSDDLTPVGARPGRDLKNSGFAVDSEAFDPDTIKVILYSLTGDSIPAGDGLEIVEVLYDVAGDAATGNTVDMSILEIVLSDPRAGSLDVSGEDGAFHIVETPASTLSIASDTTLLNKQVTLPIDLDNSGLTESDRQVSGLSFTLVKGGDGQTSVSFSDILQYVSIAAAGRAADAGFVAEAEATEDGVEVTVTHPDGATIPSGDGPIAEITFKATAPGIEELAFADVFTGDEDSLAMPEGSHESGSVTVNRAPVAVDDTEELDEDGSVDIDILYNDEEPDGDEFTVTLLDDDTKGEVEFDEETGQVHYTPTENFNGQDAFSYVLTDVYGASDTATVIVTVNAVNDAPLLSAPEDVTTNEDEAIDFEDAITVSDVDAGPDGILVILTATGSISLPNAS